MRSVKRIAVSLFSLAAAVCLSPAQTNLWIGLTNTTTEQQWTNAANWSGGIPNSTNAVADFRVDLQSNLTVELGITPAFTPVYITNNGIFFTDIGDAPDNTLTIGTGADVNNFFVFAGSNAFVENNNTITINTAVRFRNGTLIKTGSGTLNLNTQTIVGEADGVWQNILGGTLVFGGGGNAPFVDWTSINKTNGGGTLDLRNVTVFDDNAVEVVMLPDTYNVGAGNVTLNDEAPVVKTNAAPFIKTGNGTLSWGGGLAMNMSNDVIVAGGNLQVRSESNIFYLANPAKFDGNIYVSNSAIYWAISDFNANTQLGTTNGITSVQNSGQLRFQNMTNNATYSEQITLNSARTDGSLYFDQAEVTLNGPITMGSNTIINVRMVNNLQRDATIAGILDDGAESHDLFLIGQNGGQQSTNFLDRGKLLLAGSNTYGGNTYITLRNENATTLNVSNQSMIVVLSNGNHRLPTSTTVFLGGNPSGPSGGNTLANGRLVLAGMTQELAGLQTVGTGNSNAVVGGSATMSMLDLNIGASVTNIYGGLLGGPNAFEDNLALRKSGGGILVITNQNNSFTGGTHIASGVLVLGNPTDASSTIGTLGPGWVTNEGTLVLGAAGGNHAFSNLVAGTGDLYKLGGSTITVAGSNSYTGDTVVQQGVLNLAGATQSIVRGDMMVSVVTGTSARAILQASNQIADDSILLVSHSGSSGDARFIFNGYDDVIGGLSGTQAARPIIVEAAADNVANRPATMGLNVANGEAYSYQGYLRDAAGVGGSNSLLSVLKAGLGRQEFVGGNITYSGPTIITQGVLRLTDASGFRSIVTNDASLELNRSSGSHTHGAAIHGLGSLSKLGAGTISLTNGNTYTGLTLIQEGRLDINGDQSLASGQVSVFSGATLGGTGIIGGATFIQSGGIHAPGLSPGIETFALGIAYSNNATLQWELTANATATRGLQFDGIDVTGGELNVLPGADLSLIFNGSGSAVDWDNAFWDSGQQWLMFDLSGSATTNGASSLFDIASISLDSGGDTLTKGYFYTFYGAGGDMYLGYAIPEPGELVLLLLGLGILGWVGRKRLGG